ncbi:MAG: sigma-54-dependent Fis family transcriptional regulator, partial [Alphaproteobacteria bacterium]|nr:sigma-54-dependent Fis family transcriptional regulator [Alphaproteobacteria bacterium]
LMIIGPMEGHISEAGKIALKRGAKVMHAENSTHALGALRAGRGADLIMIDVRFDIADLIANLNAERFAIPVVACGIGTDAATAVAAIKAGAKEYVPLPPNAELIAAVIEAVTEDNRPMIADDASIRAVLDMADQVAPSNASILISGASGTGKELMARYIHQKSLRRNGPYISLNCAAIPENLLESELFGHERGAFTGAVARRLGKFEEANGGTLFLDEISEMDINLQAKLLRAIQEKEIDRIGSNKPVKVDIRLIATTNRNLEKEVKAGTFRQDLYFRLNVINLELPSLAERKADIPKLAKFFIDKFAAQNGVPSKPLSEGALDKLLNHSWPGNIRELENIMHRAVLISRGTEIGPESIGVVGESTRVLNASQSVQQNAAPPASAADGLVGKTIGEVEREMIVKTLDKCLGNRTHAANILGISIRTLRNKLKQYSDEGIAVPAAFGE